MKLIINADDFGISSTVNDAIVQLFEMGYIDRTSAVSNTPFFTEACQLAIEKGFENRIGVHFNIIEGRAISSKIAELRSFCTNDGMFRYRRNAKLLFSKREMDAVSAECEAQIQRFHEQGLHPIHFDSHEHIHTEWSIFRAIEPVLRNNGFLSVRISQNIGKFTLYKGAYKALFCSYLKRRNWIYEEFCGDYTAFLGLKSFSEMTDAVVEVVVHPTLNSRGLTIDAITGQELIPQLMKVKELGSVS